MVNHELIKNLAITNDSKIVMLVMDGLGGLPHPETGLTELETARTPNMDSLIKKSICGFTVPIAQGITPGSGPAHLGLFGYDPIQTNVGRGILSALGIDFPVEKNDVCARVNFCTIDDNGVVTDRRAGRIPTELNQKLASKIEENVNIPGVKVFFKPEKEHRAAMIVRGEGLSDALADTDPQMTGKKPLNVEPTENTEKARKSAKIMNQITDQIRDLLKEDHPANMILTRGYAAYPKMETLPDIYRLKCAAIAVYPMYRGLAKLVGMDVLPNPKDYEGEFEQLKEVYNDYDFFFIHIKGTDSSGEDGDFDRKVKNIEEVDKFIPKVLELTPDVFVITGDHSTPALLKAHSWHPVPTMIYSKYGRMDYAEHFGEKECGRGLLGVIPASDLMPLLMAKALRLNKFGA
ncbi:MAG: 2,3-bisphosphoglycerate-independent phosphoglycerate mutase [Vulcanimicrobiota bacterium]